MKQPTFLSITFLAVSSLSLDASAKTTETTQQATFFGQSTSPSKPSENLSYASTATLPPYRPIHRIQVSIESEQARAAIARNTITSGVPELTRSRTINSLLSNHKVETYQQAFPYSKIPELLKVYELSCIDCDTDQLRLDLEGTSSFSNFRVLEKPNLLDAGNEGGYDPSDWFWSTQAQDWMWSYVKTDVDLAWNMTQGDPNVLLAIVDIGFDTNHEDLLGKMDPIDPNTGNPLPAGDHGTQVSSVAGGETGETGTQAAGRMPSVGFNSSIVGFHVTTSPTGVSAAHYAALALNADVVNISWYGPCSPTYGGTDQLAVQEILDSGTIIVAAAGNGPSDCGGAEVFPFGGLYDDRVIVVTSTGTDDRHNYPAGVTHSHYPSVDLSAPGYDLITATPSSGWEYYRPSNGTSYAAPLVSGAAGLMKSMNSCLRPEDVQEILKESTDPVVDADNYPGMVGTGRINVNRAVALTQAPEYSCPQGGTYDGINCNLGTPPEGTNAYVYNNAYYYTALQFPWPVLPEERCPHPGSYYDGSNCYFKEIPEGVSPYVMNNTWYYTNCADRDWTQWFSRDSPSGSGDWELLSLQSGVCSDPVAIQCRAKDGTYWTQTGDKNVRCERDLGLICKKADQPDNTCENYEVRYYCP